MKKYFYYITLLVFFIVPVLNIEGANLSGFIDGQIWYSKTDIKEGDSIKIYTGLWNDNQSAISVKIEFYDKNVVLGARDIVIPSLQLKEVSIPWKVTSGDHLISAKVVPPAIISSSKKEIVLSSSNASASRLFVPVTIKKAEDNSSSDDENTIKSQIDKVAESIEDAIPSSVSKEVTNQINNIDTFRVETFDKIANNKKATEKEIAAIKKSEESVGTNDKYSDSGQVMAQTKSSAEDSIKKPVAYIKLLLLSCLYFIFGSKITFYLITAVIFLLIIRFIYRKIKNR